MMEQDMKPGKIVLHVDEVALKLDEMADLCEYWKRHRAKGRTPSGIRAALSMLSDEIVILNSTSRHS
jgi:hypothetical protein